MVTKPPYHGTSWNKERFWSDLGILTTVKHIFMWCIYALNVFQVF